MRSPVEVSNPPTTWADWGKRCMGQSLEVSGEGAGEPDSSRYGDYDAAGPGMEPGEI